MSRINEGDTGMVNKDDAGINWIRRAEVIKTPSGEGDVWGFRDLDNGREIFVTKHTYDNFIAKNQPEWVKVAAVPKEIQ